MGMFFFILQYPIHVVFVAENDGNLAVTPVTVLAMRFETLKIFTGLFRLPKTKPISIRIQPAEILSVAIQVKHTVCTI